MTAADEFARAMSAHLAEKHERDRTASDYYALLRRTGRLSSHRLLTYRCARRCLLLDLVNTPRGVIAHLPRYKLSPDVNAATSSEDGRAKNSEDGDRRWPSRTFMYSADWQLGVTCDHVAHQLIPHDRIAEDVAATRREVTLS